MTSPTFGLPEPVTLPAILEWAASRYGSHEAIVTPDGRVTYQDVAESVRKTADAMTASGIGQGDHVGLLMGNSIAWTVLFYAAASIGAVTVPINTRFRADELRYCLHQADVTALFVAGRFLKIDFLAVLREIEPAIDGALPGNILPRLRHVVVLDDDRCPAAAVSFDAFLHTAHDVRAAETQRLREHNWTRADDILLIQYTSGTTAFPKGVLLTHRGMLQNAAAAAARIGVRADDRYFSVRPFSHVGGSTLTLLVSLVSGAAVVTQPAYDVAQALRLMRDEGCTLVSGNDTIFQMLMAHPAFDASVLRLRGGWAAVGAETMRRIHHELGAVSMVNAYGLSEASPNVVMNDWRDPPELRVSGWAHPHAGIDVRIVSPETGARQPPHHPGEIHVRGWSVMKGYYNMPEETARAIDEDGWLRTGDLGEMDDDGRMRMVGRVKDIIRVGGENVSPAEVENTLLEHPAVVLAQVVGVPDARLVEVPVAYVQLKPEAAATADEIRTWCAARCAAFKAPRHVRIVDSFDWVGLTSSGKMRKTAIRERALRDLGLDAPDHAQRTS
jgi:fatty-acyl-CoA synthase